MDLRETREATVREHMESENRHDFDVTLGTFAHPRYEIVPTGEIYDGREEVALNVDEVLHRNLLGGERLHSPASTSYMSNTNFDT